MSDPQRHSRPGVTPGEEPGAGIADPATVEGGTLPPTGDAHADEEDRDPGGYPHSPAESVPENPADDPR